VELDEYQRLAALTDQRRGKDEGALIFPLVGLAAEVGSMFRQFKQRIRDGEAHALFTDRVVEQLGDVLWYTANLATKLDLNFQTIADVNLRRIRERWPTEGAFEFNQLLDEDFPEAERLPRHAEIEFRQVLEGDRKRVRLYWDGQQLGDPLWDMSWEEDDYRFHDAFHLTYAALLGWSPISRWLFGRQRNSKPRFRGVEDSGRAKVIEEAVAALAFEYARNQQFFAGVRFVDSALLQTVRSMTSGLEVRIRSAREWESAILRSFEVWRLLGAHEGGTILMDLENRSASFVPPA
jgi:NTP pyrophosphatase (non-canonical NTP hydrolase)